MTDPKTLIERRVEAAAREIWDGFCARMGGAWSEQAGRISDSNLVAAIQCVAVARAAIEAADALTESGK